MAFIYQNKFLFMHVLPWNCFVHKTHCARHTDQANGGVVPSSVCPDFRIKAQGCVSPILAWLTEWLDFFNTQSHQYNTYSFSQLLTHISWNLSPFTQNCKHNPQFLLHSRNLWIFLKNRIIISKQLKLWSKTSFFFRSYTRPLRTKTLHSSH